MLIRRARAISGRLRSYLVGKEPPKRRLETSHSLLQAAGWEKILESPSLGRAIKDLAGLLPVRTDQQRLHAKFAELLAELALIEGNGEDEHSVLELAFSLSERASARALFDLYEAVFTKLELQVVGKFAEDAATLKVTGPHAKLLLASERGFHLFAQDDGLSLVEVLGKDIVVRAYDKENGSIDLRSGWMCPSLPEAGEMEYMILCALSNQEGALS